MHITNLQRAGSVLGSKVTPQSITQGSLSDACKQSHDSRQSGRRVAPRGDLVHGVSFV